MYFAETVLALEYLHSYGIVHRDLKPDKWVSIRPGFFFYKPEHLIFIFKDSIYYGLSKIVLFLKANLLTKF